MRNVSVICTATGSKFLIRIELHRKFCDLKRIVISKKVSKVNGLCTWILFRRHRLSAGVKLLRAKSQTLRL